MKVTKVYYSVDEKNGLKYTVGVKSLGLLSTTIDKASGGILKGEEVQLKCSPEYAEGAIINLTLVQVAEKHDEKAISDKTTTEKAESENVAAKTNSSAKTITAKQVDLSVLLKSLRTEEGTSQQETHMGTSQHGVDVNAQQEVLEHGDSPERAFQRHSGSYHFRQWRLVDNRRSRRTCPLRDFQKTVVEQAKTKLMSSFIQQPEASCAAHIRQSGQIVGMIEQMLSHIRDAYEHDEGTAGCTKRHRTVSNWKKNESTQDSWVTSASKWFADEKEDTGLQIAENSKCFGITSSIMSFSNEGKELISQYEGYCGCPGCACEEMIKL